MADYERGDFERAARALAEIESEGTLTRQALVRLLVHRALVAHALSDEAALDTVVLQLATLAPDALEGRAPPPILRRLETALERTGGERLRVEVEHRATDGGLRVDAHLRGDVGGLARRVTLRARVRGRGGWPDATEGPIVLDAEEPERIEVVASAIGPGGAAIAVAGTASHPLRLSRAVPDSPEDDPGAHRDRTGDDTALHVALVSAAIALVVGGVALGVGLGVSSSQPDGPIHFSGPAVLRW
ncbi:MAG TPA: hypothetical protein RMH99_20245 [Sandaracinaceae bacterium LLY-WYZ-13_1]|nr:hypothetical protein [Sandaracinaceae bacterium LLY-WYZ-13_1]